MGRYEQMIAAQSQRKFEQQVKYQPMPSTAKIKLCLAILCLGIFITSAASSADEPTSKPNFLFILSDDQAPATIGAMGNSEVNTPNLDMLAKRGTAFTHCFNQGSWSGAVCVASRTMLITGQTVYHAPQNTTYLDPWAEQAREEEYPKAREEMGPQPIGIAQPKTKSKADASEAP